MGIISVKGAAKVVRLYNVTIMQIEGLDVEDYDLESREDVRELFERVTEFVETGEVEAFEPPIELQGVDPEECTIKVGEKTLYPDEITLKNQNIIDLLPQIQESEDGEIYYIQSLEGDGLWDIDAEDENIDPSKLTIGYVDCSVLFDQYDILREGYLDVICDTILPPTIEAGDIVTEVEDFVFHPVQVYAQLYEVKTDPITGVKILQKVDFGGRFLAGADFLVDDFEEN